MIKGSLVKICDYLYALLLICCVHLLLFPEQIFVTCFNNKFGIYLLHNISNNLSLLTLSKAFTQSIHAKQVSKLYLPFSVSIFIVNDASIQYLPFQISFWQTKGTVLLVLSIFH